MPSLSHPTSRRLRRFNTRMLGGKRRPPPTDWLGLYCRAWEEILRIDERLVPFLEEQERLRESRRFQQEMEAISDKVYGPCNRERPPATPIDPTPADIAQFRDDLQALEKTRALTAHLKAKLDRRR